MKNRTILFAAAAALSIAALTVVGLPSDASAAFGSSDSKLDKDDCIKCHATTVQQVQEAGSKHKSEVSCLECHAGQHPPGIQKGSLIPQCAQCHSGEPHFEVQVACLNCHTNPHQPLNIALDSEGVKAVCNTCHSQVVQEIDTNVTAHTGFACSFCHEEHRVRPDCLNCHDPHTEGQQFANCVNCHQAHQPLTLAYTDTVPNSDCAACHSDIRDTLEAGKTKHAGFQCVFCHENKHGVVPNCNQCHEAPHSEQMLSKFQSCNECHQSAHGLVK